MDKNTIRKIIREELELVFRQPIFISYDIANNNISLSSILENQGWNQLNQSTYYSFNADINQLKFDLKNLFDGENIKILEFNSLSDYEYQEGKTSVSIISNKNKAIQILAIQEQ